MAVLFIAAALGEILRFSHLSSPLSPHIWGRGCRTYLDLRTQGLGLSGEDSPLQWLRRGPHL